MADYPVCGGERGAKGQFDLPHGQPFDAHDLIIPALAW